MGYPIIVPAFQRLTELGLPEAEDTEPVEPVDQLAQRWSRPYLTVRERAIACLTVDAFYQTLGESLRLHAAAAQAAGATEETFRDLIRGLAEFGLARAWATAAALLPRPVTD